MTNGEAVSLLMNGQYYNRGYKQGVSDVINKIRSEIGNINLNEVAAKYEDKFYGFQREVIKILDKYKAESEDNNAVSS